MFLFIYPPVPLLTSPLRAAAVVKGAFRVKDGRVGTLPSGLETEEKSWLDLSREETGKLQQ